MVAAAPLLRMTVLSIAAGLVLLTTSPVDAGMTKAQAFAWAKTIENSVADSDPGPLADSIDQRRLFERSLTGLNVPKAIENGLYRGFTSEGGFRAFAGEIVRQVEAGGSYRLLRIHSVNGEWRALFRLINDQGFNYHDFYLRQTAAGRISVEDIFVFVNGETLSDSMRRAFLPAVAHTNEGWDGKESGWERTYVRHLDDIQRLYRLQQRGQLEQAMKLYKGLPKVLREDKNILMQRLNIATRMMGELDKGEAYLAAVRDYRRLYPNSPNIDLLVLDFHFLNEQWKDVLSALDRLDRRVGGDPYLNLFRANVRISEGKIAEGKAMLRSLVKKEPTIPDAYYVLLTHSLEENDNAETTRLLISLRENAGFEYPQIDRQEEFQRYVKSDEYANWKKYLRSVQ